jgi:hypothetical protein
MAEVQATSKSRYPQSFHMDEAGNDLVLETMRLGGYREKSALFRDAVKKLNKTLKTGVKA